MRRGGKFDPDAQYFEAATGFERAQLNAMARIIEAKAEELRDLRAQRHGLALRIRQRHLARIRRLKLMGPPPVASRTA